MQRDSSRTRIWFPMFSYFEDSVECIIPNEFDSIADIVHNLKNVIKGFRDMCIQTAHQFVLNGHEFTSKNLLLVSGNVPASTVFINGKQLRNVSTSTISSSNVTSNTQSTSAAEQQQSQSTKYHTRDGGEKMTVDDSKKLV